MVKVEVDISLIRNEIERIHQALHETYNMSDTQRRDAVNRLVEKVRTLKVELESKQINAYLK